MLVLSRKLYEQVVIDGNIVVTVVAVRGKTVRLGFSAPQAVAIHRKEISERLPQRTTLRKRLGAKAARRERVEPISNEDLCISA
jgi:carbon storage regulator